MNLQYVLALRPVMNFLDLFVVWNTTFKGALVAKYCHFGYCEDELLSRDGDVHIF